MKDKSEHSVSNKTQPKKGSSIGTKLVGGLLLVALLFIIAGGMNIYYLWQIKQGADKLAEKQEIAYLITQLDSLVYEKYVSFTDLYVANTISVIKYYDEYEKEFDAILSRLSQLVSDAQHSSILSELEKANERLDGIFHEVMVVAWKENNETEMLQATNRALSLRRIMQQKLAGILADTGQASDDAVTNIQLVSIRSMKQSAIISLVALLCGLAFFIPLTRSISRPLHQIADNFTRLAQGNLALAEIQVKSHDELGMLARGFNSMVANLNRLVSNLREISQRLSSSSKELAMVADETSKSTEQVAASTEQLARGAEQHQVQIEKTQQNVDKLSQNIGLVAQTVQSLAHMSDEVVNKARAGNQVVQEAANQMKNINSTVQQSSQLIKHLGKMSGEIGKIVEVISNIADQTNLLALNAAIEAARAGEHGLGFAVVSEEVRKLAEQSADAAMEISSIIQQVNAETGKAVQSMNEGQEAVEQGRQVILKLESSFNEIVEAIGRAAEQFKEVALAAQDMDTGSKEVVAAVENMRQLIEDAAAAVQEVSASMEEQSASANQVAATAKKQFEMASQVESLVAQFTIRSDSNHTTESEENKTKEKEEPVDQQATT